MGKSIGWVILGLGLLLLQQVAFAEQVCKYDSIPATAPASRFANNFDGTVTDTFTGLQWKRCSEGQTWSGGTCTGTASTHTWQQALQLADGASFAGRGDWRLPNLKELSSIVEQACYGPAIDLTVFPGTPSSPGSIVYRSSSPIAFRATDAWHVIFQGGYDGADSKSHGHHVRLVRGGQ